MKKIFVVAVLTTLAIGTFATTDKDVHAEILKFESHIDHNGNYNYVYETSNSITAEEKGTGGKFAKGGYAYYSPEGELIQMAYEVDENGFHPKSEILPTPPPIPAAILRSLEYIRTHPQKDDH
ncbi:pupal cuticle protein Edg-78E-like [Stomoxys calcitrans]|uniref:Pupal cuticle protein Edg-78E n=1 Tax=Stomoxys calcitrans TaxID=35570 RepID=A0A1I8P0Y9_STOCA|nr:pupal cuticle protein Edg-78E-like [Stomoxys calcitrans]